MEKTLLFILVALFAFAALQGQVTAKFKNDRHDFGKIDKRTKEFVETTFKITNVGEKPLLIYKVDVSCGCVSPDFTKKPIKKGETGYVKLILNVKQLNGRFNKVAYVKTNATKDKGVMLLRVNGVAE